MNAMMEIDKAGGGALVEITPQTALAVFTDRAKYSEFYARMKAETDKFVPDLTTKKGRDAIASEARKVVTAKTTLEKAGKALVEGWREQTKAVTSARIEMVNELDALAKEVRRPLTEWEQAEKDRIAECDAIITQLALASVITMDDTAATVRDRGAEIWAIEIDADRFDELYEQAAKAKQDAVARLKAALARLTQEEADRAELARLRAENEAREAREAEEGAARKAAEREAEELRQVEERRLAAEKAESERIEAAKEAAAQAARDDEARKAREAQAERDREHEAALQAERDRAAEADRLRQAEIDKAAEIERQREKREAAERAEAKRIADEQAEREANKAHRTKVKTAAKQAIMTCGVSEDAAQKIVLAIIAGEVPAVTLRF